MSRKGEAMARKAIKLREIHQKKLSTKGRKSLRGQPELYSETKTTANFTLTPFAKHCLNQQARRAGLSMSEFLERLIRWSANPANAKQSAHAYKFIAETPPMTAPESQHGINW
jgi:hypothetical protein